MYTLFNIFNHININIFLTFLLISLFILLGNNQLPPDESVLDIISGMESVVTLNIAGNEINKLPHFRKRTITRMPILGYLDRPIEPQERLGAEAFVSGGVQAETKV
jgi:hypothetical protein